MRDNDSSEKSTKNWMYTYVNNNDSLVFYFLIVLGKLLPIISVTNAEISTNNKVAAIKSGDGPLSKDPVLMANRRYKGAMQIIKNKANATVVKNT